MAPAGLKHVPEYTKKFHTKIYFISSTVLGFLIHYNIQGYTSFPKSLRYLNILGARRVVWSKLHTEGPKLLDTTVHNLDDTVTWRPGFLHPWQYVTTRRWCKSTLLLLHWWNGANWENLLSVSLGPPKFPETVLKWNPGVCGERLTEWITPSHTVNTMSGLKRIF
jgi:hypothetical protein